MTRHVFDKRPEDDGLPPEYTKEEQGKLILDTFQILKSCPLRADISTVRALTLAASVVAKLSGGAQGQVVVTANNVAPLVNLVLRMLRSKGSKPQVDIRSDSDV